MKQNDKKDGLQDKLENIELDLTTFKVLLHFQNHTEPLLIHFDKPARRFYFSLIALVIKEMKNQDRPEFVHIRRHEKTLKLLDHSLAGKNASKTVDGMWDKVRKAWRYILPDLETGTHFKILERTLIPPYEKGGKYRYDCSDDECNIWANLFEYDENNPWRFKFAVDSASIGLSDISLISGGLRDNTAWQEFIKRLSKQPKAVSGEKRAVPRWWKKVAFSIMTILIVGAVAWAVWNSYIRPVPPTADLGLSESPSIAVLPFENISDDPKQEYFADGITDDLITDLSKIAGLFVIASNSTFTYKGKPVNIKQVAEELGVRYVLEGSVRRAGDEVRINAQLIDSITGGHLWADRYDGRMGDIFALQDKITGQIVKALAVHLTADEERRFVVKETSSIEAYDAFLQGWQHYLSKTPEDFKKAVPYFKKAIELYPDYGRAYAALALTYWRGAGWGWARKMGMRYDEARIRGVRTMEIALKNPSSIAHRLASEMFVHRHKFDKAISEAQLALALEPNDAENHIAMARILTNAGRPEEAIPYAKRSMLLNPRDKSVPLGRIALARFCMGQFEEAAKLSKEALKLNPEFHAAASVLAASYAHLGRIEEAGAAMEIYYKGWGRSQPRLEMAMYFFPFKNPEHAESLAEGFPEAGMPGKPSGYFKVSDKLKLSGEEITSLFFGTEIAGFVGKNREWRIGRMVNGEAKFWYRSELIGSGRSWLEGDALCNQWDKAIGGLKYCMDVFRNPEGTPEEQNEYVLLTDYGIFGCSIEH